MYVKHAVYGEFTIAQAGDNSIQASITGTLGTLAEVQASEVKSRLVPDHIGRIWVNKLEEYGEALPPGIKKDAGGRPIEFSGIWGVV